MDAEQTPAAALTASASQLWECLAATAARFDPAVTVAVSPESALCPAGAVGPDHPGLTQFLQAADAGDVGESGLREITSPARAAASAAVACAIEEGRLPQWRARSQASRSVARALGFRELGSQVSVQLAEGATAGRLGG